jgi:Glycine zipper
MMKARFAIPVILMAGFAAFANTASASDEVFGAILGGATGAVFGRALGGRDGAVVGGALGAAVGAVSASDHDRRVVVYPAPRPAYGPPPPMAYGPPPAVVYDAPRVVYAPPPVMVAPRPVHYGWRAEWRERHEDHRDHGPGRGDHRGW